MGQPFFIIVYIHILRGMYYGSYKYPRELNWILGVFIYLLMMATAFMGYTLPWGQMSYWGATVITNLFSAIPFIGEGLKIWLLVIILLVMQLLIDFLLCTMCFAFCYFRCCWFACCGCSCSWIK